MGIRRMRPGDIHTVSRMVADAFLDGVAATVSEQGFSTFMKICSPESFLDRLDGPNRMWVEDRAGEIRGMIEVREKRHVAMLFVAPRWQRRGVGHALVQAALKDCAGPWLTVNASLTSVGAYERYGFEVAGPEAETAGLRYRPMRKPLTAPRRPDGPPGEGGR